MTCSNICEIRKIPIYYKELKNKQLFIKLLSEMNTCNKKVHLFYYKYNNIPICTIPRLKIIIISKKSFLSFCYNFYIFINSFTTKDILISKKNISTIAKCAICHELGHIIDPSLSVFNLKSRDILLSIANSIIKYNIDLTDDYYHKKNLPLEIEDFVIQFKKNTILREVNAWNLGENIVNFEDEFEKYIFKKIKEYAIATYNFGNLKNIVSENKIEDYIKNPLSFPF